VLTCLRWTPLFLFLLASSEAVGGQNDSLRSENQRLETEIRIAQTRQVYSIFDLGTQKITLKARGVLLRELRIEAFRVWGNLPTVTAAPLVRKSALFAPKRVVVSPKSEDDEAQPSEETLELKDMPTNYSLGLEGNISISVRTRPTHVLSRLWSLRYPVQWYLARPVLTVWHALWRQPYTSIEIVLEESDARSLYWSFLEGMVAIVCPPGRRP
jgi:hypothetical protein